MKSGEVKPPILVSRETFFFGEGFVWGERRGLNPRPLEPQSRALPAELRPPGPTLALSAFVLAKNTGRGRDFNALFLEGKRFALC